MHVIGLDRYELERRENWDAICVAAPFFAVPPNCEVSIIPPFAGAVARMRFRRGETVVSMYLDWYSALGAVSVPYFEIFPVQGDTLRFGLDQMAEMSEAVNAALDEPPHVFEPPSIG